MANVNAPQGLSPVRYRNGAPWTGGGNVYYIASTDSNAFAIGDPVTLSGSGDTNGVAGITLATAGTGDLVLGAIVGFGGLSNGGAYVDPANPNTTVIPAAKAHGYYVLVCDDPNVVFEIQEGGSGSALTASSIGQNADLKSGTNSGYLSGWTFDNATLGTGATLQVKLLGLAQTSDNAFGQYAKWLAVINNHQFAAGTAGV